MKKKIHHAIIAYNVSHVITNTLARIKLKDISINIYNIY